MKIDDLIERYRVPEERIRQCDVVGTRIEGIVAEGDERKNIAFLLPISEQIKGRIATISAPILQFVQHLKNCGHNVDFYTGAGNFYSALAAKRYDVAAFSGTTNELETILDLAGQVKRDHPEILTVVGGHVAKGYYWALPHHPGVDVAIQGESEILFPLLLETLGKKQPIDSSYLRRLEEARARRIIKTRNGKEQIALIRLSGISVKVRDHRLKTGYRAIHFSERPLPWYESPYPTKWEVDDFFTTDLDIFRQRESEHSGFSIPLDLLYPRGLRVSPTGIDISLPDEEPAIREGQNWYTFNMYAQRGCPYACNICAIDYGVRKPSVEKVLDLIGRVLGLRNQFGRRAVQSISFSDDNFTTDKEWTKQLLRAIIEKGYHQWVDYTALSNTLSLMKGNEVDIELIELLRDAHFTLDFGLESLHPKSIERIGKLRNPQQYIETSKRVIEACLEQELHVRVYLIASTDKSQLIEVAEDYDEISSFIAEMYKKHGRVVAIGGMNATTWASYNTKLGRELMGHVLGRSFSDKQVTESVQRQRRTGHPDPHLFYHNGLVGRMIHLAENVNIFYPTGFVMAPEVNYFVDQLNSKTKRDFLAGLESILSVAEALEETCDAYHHETGREIENGKEIRAKAQMIKRRIEKLQVHDDKWKVAAVYEERLDEMLDRGRFTEEQFRAYVESLDPETCKWYAGMRHIIRWHTFLDIVLDKLRPVLTKYGFEAEPQRLLDVWWELWRKANHFNGDDVGYGFGVGQLAFTTTVEDYQRHLEFKGKLDAEGLPHIPRSGTYFVVEDGERVVLTSETI